MVRVRFAPSPTGYLHVGGARTALFNWLFAKKHGGQFLLRIEDTDKERSTEESTQKIFEGLNWLGLKWDEDVVFQGARSAEHRKAVAELHQRGAAYPCFCAPEEIAAKRAAVPEGQYRYDGTCARLSAEEQLARIGPLFDSKPYVMRFRVPEGLTGWDDLVHGRIEFPNKDIDDFIILRSDGSPIYNLAVVVDDMDMRITHVLRGDDHISNTPKQIMLYNAFGAPVPQFGHMPMILGKDGKKLSKRHGATAVGDYQNQGILPETMLNFLGLLGWNPGNDVEVMTLDEMAGLFSEERLLKKAAVFDPQKLEWMNGQHLSRADTERLVNTIVIHKVLSALRDRNQWGVALPMSKLEEAVTLIKGRVRTTHELVRQVLPFVVETPDLEPAAVEKHLTGQPEFAARALHAARKVLAAALETGSGYEALLSRGQEFDASMRALAATENVKPVRVFQPVRVALVGSETSPGLWEVITLLGPRRSLERIDTALGALNVRV